MILSNSFTPCFSLIVSGRVAALGIKVREAGVIEHDVELDAQEQAGVSPPECGAARSPCCMVVDGAATGYVYLLLGVHGAPALLTKGRIVALATDEACIDREIKDNWGVSKGED